MRDMISGHVEFHTDDAGLSNTMFADKIIEIRKSDYPTHRVARFENTPDEILDKLTPYWDQYECVLDETPSI